jgi:L-malate glycosyltransferase
MRQPRPILLMVRALTQGGSERQMASVAQSLDRARFNPRVGVFIDKGIRADELRSAGVPIVHFPVSSFASFDVLRQGWRLRRYIIEHNIELVHSFDVPTNLFSVPFGRLARRAIVLSSQRAHRELTPGLYGRLLRVTDRLAHGVVVNCDFMRRHLVDDEGVPPDRIHLCYNAIDIDAFHPARGGHTQVAGDASLVIGVVCALRAEKGLSTLLDAFYRVHAATPGLRLILVGDGPVRLALERQAQALGIASRVTFIPQTADVAPILRGIDIFVLPSLSEAFSNSLMEAMASGCCAVASSVGGNPELIEDGRTGFLFPKQDAGALAIILKRLIDNPEMRLAVAHAARQQIVRKFSLGTSISRMADIYESFLQEHGSLISPGIDSHN